MKSLVSVVIASYNGEAFLGETLESVLSQEYEPVEVIVCDDGSQDGTVKLVRSFGERVRLVAQPNGGVSSARNHGARESHGSLIAFVDQDDVWERNLLSTLVPKLERHPHWGLVYSDSWVVDANGRRRGLRRAYLDYAEGWIFPRLLTGNFIPIETTVMRRSVFDRVNGFDESLRYLEDYDLNLRIARLYPIGFHAEPLARYRIHDGNLSHDIEALLREWARLLESLREEKYELSSEERMTLEREIRLRFGELAWHAIRRGDLQDADELLERAGPDCRATLRWKVKLPRMLLGALPKPVANKLVRMLPRRKLYGVSSD